MTEQDAKEIALFLMKEKFKGKSIDSFIQEFENTANGAGIKINELRLFAEFVVLVDD